MKASYKKALEDSATQIKALEEKAAGNEQLEAQVTSLKLEKEDNSNKLSELEIEILELKETQEGLEDTRDKLHRRITTLEDSLTQAAAANALAVETANEKEKEHLAQLNEQAKQHEEELTTRSKRHTEIAASLAALEAKCAETSRTYEQARQDIESIEQAHALKISELEQAHAAQRDAQSAELAKVRAELEVRFICCCFQFLLKNFVYL